MAALWAERCGQHRLDVDLCRERQAFVLLHHRRRARHAGSIEPLTAEREYQASHRLDSREKKMQALEGAMGLLECPVFQYGSGQRVTWTKERSVEVTKISPRLTVNQRSGALRIHRAQFTDSGRYTCTVRDGNDTMSRDTTLDVVSYPRITMVQNASVARGEEATLLCKVESTPASDISWHRLDVPLGPPEVTAAPQSENTMDYDVFTSTSEGVTSVTVSELRYRSVQPGHAGLYLCLAANDPGSARAILALSVIYAPIATVPEPVVVAWAGKVPDIHMIFKATPPPRIDPEKASNETDIYTNYSCTATNTVGQTTASVTVTEGRAPDPPQVRIDSQRPTWIVLEITMPPYMGIPPADRIVTRYEDLTSLEEIKEFDEGNCSCQQRPDLSISTSDQKTGEHEWTRTQSPSLLEKMKIDQ
ncbi:hypothetical protein C0Q70_12746 [Pomacea canaliculata]|uniref:Ig-like domain-containing protein n=1 Tax=Pomacea canaliculata TaxID=400727 RepID=A0A2T7P2E4_POMCA|nr:hypothetical protein C0Q70_12746 [Pomacea canaliculata]